MIPGDYFLYRKLYPREDNSIKSCAICDSVFDENKDDLRIKYCTSCMDNKYDNNPEYWKKYIQHQSLNKKIENNSMKEEIGRIFSCDYVNDLDYVRNREILSIKNDQENKIDAVSSQLSIILPKLFDTMGVKYSVSTMVKKLVPSHFTRPIEDNCISVIKSAILKILSEDDSYNIDNDKLFYKKGKEVEENALGWKDNEGIKRVSIDYHGPDFNPLSVNSCGSIFEDIFKNKNTHGSPVELISIGNDKIELDDLVIIKRAIMKDNVKNYSFYNKDNYFLVTDGSNVYKSNSVEDFCNFIQVNSNFISWNKDIMNKLGKEIKVAENPLTDWFNQRISDVKDTTGIDLSKWTGPDVSGVPEKVEEKTKEIGEAIVKDLVPGGDIIDTLLKPSSMDKLKGIVSKRKTEDKIKNAINKIGIEVKSLKK